MGDPLRRLHDYIIGIHTLATLNPALRGALGSYPKAISDVNSILNITARNEIRHRLERPRLRPERKFTVLGSKRTNRQSIADQFGDKTPQPDQCLVLYENENVFWQNTEWLDFCRWLAPIGSSHRA